MSDAPDLPIDREQLAQFLGAMCRYADEGSFLSVRAFYDDKSEPFFAYGYRVGADLTGLLPSIAENAARCTRVKRPVVFCPPLATFANEREATEAALTNGLALSVECDKAPMSARSKLESLLGPATVVVASGGEWADPDTGEVQDRLHLHWRLSEPTRTAADHATLKQARISATWLVGGDASNKPIVHPIRWPGSWHRKCAPRLTRIIAQSDTELDLSDALERLAEAVRAMPPPTAVGAVSAQSGERETAELVRALVTTEDYHSTTTALAMRFLKAGMVDGQAVHVLRGMMLAIPETQRDGSQPGRWQARYDDLPRAVSTARAKLGAGQSMLAAVSAAVDWPVPLDFLATGDGLPPVLRPDHLPAALAPFVMDTAERMGADPAGVALGCIVACASALSDNWRVQPKRHDYTWTESPRLWGAIVGDPSILKTPVLAACTSPLDRIEADARQKHAEAMRLYKRQLKAAKADKSGAAPDPVHPRLDRYLIEGATVEAISEVLRDDDDATQRAPARKVLSRHDEMSEFFGNLDRYKAGGKGGGDRGAYLRLFNGGPYSIDRIGRGSFTVPNWSACFLGGIQPGPIQRIAKDAADDGLLQRFLYVVPGAQGQGIDRAPDGAARQLYSDLFPALAAMQPPRALDGQHTDVVAFHTDAHQHREGTDNLARAMAAMPDTSTRLKAAFGKWPGIFARLALTFHLIDVAHARVTDAEAPYMMVISAATAARVAAFMREVILPHLLRADAVMFATTQAGHAKWIAGYILAHSFERVTTRDVMRAYRPLNSPEAKGDLADTMASLVAVGWLEPEPSVNPARPVNAWQVNPAVHTRFAEIAEHERQRREEVKEVLAAAWEAIRVRDAA